VTTLPWEVDFPALDRAVMDDITNRWNNIAKPKNSLGHLEKAVTKIAGLTGVANYSIDKRIVMVFCADNGVVKQGVARTGSEVTEVLARCMASGDITVCKMASVAHADVVGVDMGIYCDLQLPELLDRRIAAGTDDISRGPAMSLEQAITGIRHGMELAREYKDRGYKIIVTGEVGIGNTTTSSAMASVYLDADPVEVTGRGAGLDPEGVARKAAVIKKAITTNNPNPDDALDVLAKLGGFDIAGMTGVFLGGALYRIPVLVDGLISSIAALTAAKLNPDARNAMLASHVSAEPAGGKLLGALCLDPLICANLCLGEGTGAVAALPLLDMAYAVYKDMLTYEEIAIGKYTPKG
jgi:nicotinate-nucleotide--dimethylbenzimidazole phosphoribosyltransferase